MKYIWLVLLAACTITAPQDRVLRINHTALVPAGPWEVGVHRAEWIEPGDLPAHQEFRAVFMLPADAEITRVQAYMYRERGSELVTGAVWAIAQERDAVFMFSHPGQGWSAVEGQVINRVRAPQYKVYLVLGVPPDGARADARFAYVDIHYR